MVGAAGATRRSWRLASAARPSATTRVPSDTVLAASRWTRPWRSSAASSRYAVLVGNPASLASVATVASPGSSATRASRSTARSIGPAAISDPRRLVLGEARAPADRRRDAATELAVADLAREPLDVDGPLGLVGEHRDTLAHELIRDARALADVIRTAAEVDRLRADDQLERHDPVHQAHEPRGGPDRQRRHRRVVLDALRDLPAVVQ